MTRKNALPVLTIVGLVAVLLVVVLTQLSPPARAADAPAVGGLTVIGGQPPILFEPGTGKTWVLVSSQNLKKQAWVPVKRLDSDADIQKWQIMGAAGGDEKPGRE